MRRGSEPCLAIARNTKEGQKYWELLSYNRLFKLFYFFIIYLFFLKKQSLGNGKCDTLGTKGQLGRFVIVWLMN